MKGLLLKDFYVTVKNLKIYLLVLAIFLAAGVMDRSNVVFLYFLPIFGGMIPVTLLAYDERSRWTQYSLALPYGRKQIVSAKYLFGLIAQIIMAVLSMTALFFVGASFTNLMVFLVTATATSCIVPALCLPIVFKFGVEKGRIVYFVTVGICVGIGGAGIETAPGFSPEAAEIISQGGAGIKVTALTAAAALIYFLSWLLSVKIFKNKEL